MFGVVDPEIPHHLSHQTPRRYTMTMKERTESALHTAIMETSWAIRELAAAEERKDTEAISHWLAAAAWWSKRTEEYEKQLKEVNG